MSDLATDPVVAPSEPGEHDRFAHWVRRDQIVEAQVTGSPIRALCGKVWVPNRDPDRYPICPTCEDIKMRFGIRREGTD